MQILKRARGFTLIELLVVIVILATLAIIGIVLFQNSRRSAIDAKRISDMQAIQKALTVYYFKNGNYSSNPNIYDEGFLEPYFSDGKVPYDPVPNQGNGLPGEYQNHVCPTQFRVCQQLENSTSGNAGGSTTLCTDAFTPGKGFYCVREVIQ